MSDGKYSKISNNCTRFESNTEVTIRFDSKFRIFAQHYLLFDCMTCNMSCGQMKYCARITCT